MTMALNTAVRTAKAQATIDGAGANCKMKFYDGTRPASGGAATGTLLATLNFTSLGTATSGVLTLGSATQNNATHVSGTPTWMRITTSADAWVGDFSIPADMTFTGTIATGVDITLGASTITEGNA